MRGRTKSSTVYRPQLYRAIEDSPNLSLGIARATSFVEVIMFNTGKPPFDNQLVRQAAMYSIDAQQLIDVGLQGEGRIARSPLPPESDRFLEPQQQYNYDPERSLQLLAEAGVETPLTFELGVVEWAYVAPQAPLFAQQMQEGGFNPLLLVDSIDARWASDIQRPESGEPARYDAWIATLGFEVFSFDPDMLFRGWWSGLADLANFNTPGVAQLTGLPRPGARRTGLRKAERVVLGGQRDPPHGRGLGADPVPALGARVAQVGSGLPDAADPRHDALRSASVRGCRQRPRYVSTTERGSRLTPVEGGTA